jgi:Tfp pilus assembly protein PilX
MKSPFLSVKDSSGERGAILVVVLVLVFAVTLALLAYLYLNNNNTLIASNLAVQNMAQEASDVGLDDASTWLNQLPTVPEILATSNSQALAPRFFLTMPTSGYLASNVNATTAPIQPPTDPQFWSQCAANNQCYQLPQPVTVGSQQFQVEYVIFPNGLPNQPLAGYEQNQSRAGSVSAYFYVAYVHVARVNGGGLGVTIQAVLRKVLAS